MKSTQTKEWPKIFPLYRAFSNQINHFPMLVFTFFFKKNHKGTLCRLYNFPVAKFQSLWKKERLSNEIKRYQECEMRGIFWRDAPLPNVFFFHFCCQNQKSFAKFLFLWTYVPCTLHCHIFGLVKKKNCQHPGLRSSRSFQTLKSPGLCFTAAASFFLPK